MFELTLLLIISFLTGISTKLVDLIEDNGLKLFKLDKYIFAVIYGLLIGYVISNYNLVASLWIGTLFALILSKKIDTKAHVIGVLSAFVFVAFFGFGNINIIFLIIFLIAAFLDEVLSDFTDKQSIKNKSMLKKIIFRSVKNKKIRINHRNRRLPLTKVRGLARRFLGHGENKVFRCARNAMHFRACQKSLHPTTKVGGIAIFQHNKIKRILELRPLLEISALAVSFIIWDFSLFLAILFYDVGYILTNNLGLKFKK